MEEFYIEGHSAVLVDERRKDRTSLRAVEDEAIRDAIRRQVDLGLDVVSAGEFRRWMFLDSFYDAASADLRLPLLVAGTYERIHADPGGRAVISTHGFREQAS